MSINYSVLNILMRLVRFPLCDDLSHSLYLCVFFPVTFPIRSMLFCSLIFTKRFYLNAMYAFIFGFGKFFTRSGYLFSIFFPFMWFILYPNSIHVNNAIKTIVLCCCYFFSLLSMRWLSYRLMFDPSEAW